MAAVSTIVAAVIGIASLAQAKKAGDQVQSNAQSQARIAAEAARGNALSQQSATEAESARRVAQENADKSAAEGKAVPDVSVAAAPAEKTRRKKVSAQFDTTGGAGSTGSIRL